MFMESDIPTHKYFKTYHLPFTRSSTSDDKILTPKQVQEYFYPMNEVFVSIKRDGECTTIGRGFSHARSLDSKSHWSRNHIKELEAKLFKDIEPGWRICGENLLAVHSIRYDDLISFFEVFSVWNNKNEKLSLDDTLEYCDFLGLPHVPIITRDKFSAINFPKIENAIDWDKEEGYVVANAASFHYDDAAKNIAKVVRAMHVQTEDKHWFNKPIDKNTLRLK